MADPIDRINFDDLNRLDPAEVCRRTPCTYNAVKRSYTIDVWGEPYCIAPADYSVLKMGPEPVRDHGLLSLFAVHYLLEKRSTALTGTWISEKELPGGATFYRGPHDLPTHLITERFANDLAAFDRRCKALHGTPLELADAAYRFEIVPQVPVALLYWCGDDEFPPEAKLLFDKNLGRYLASDVVYALAVGICERMGR